MSATPAPKVIVLSGGSRGLGLHLAEHLLEQGHIVATFARGETPAMQRLSAAHGERFSFTALDARNAEGMGRFVRGVVERHGRIDGLVNNAAIGQDHLLANLPPERITDILDINLLGAIVLTRHVIRHMLVAGEGGRIVTITSICGSRGYAGLSVYSATKGAMDAFTRSLAREVGPRGILVNAIAPGFFVSEMSSVLAPSQIDTIRRRTPTEKLIGEADVLPILDMLLFADINMTGQVVAVDGGLTS